MGWDTAMLDTLAAGKLPTLSPSQVPKSMRKAAALLDGDSAVVFGLTPSLYDALGVPSSHRPRAGGMLRQLVKSIPSTEKIEKPKLAQPGKGSGNYHSWIALNAKGLEALSEAAAQTTPSLLYSQLELNRRGISIDSAVQRELAEQGLLCCHVCTMPVLDPADQQYEQKAAVITAVGRRGDVITGCVCESLWCAK